MVTALSIIRDVSEAAVEDEPFGSAAHQNFAVINRWARAGVGEPLGVES